MKARSKAERKEHEHMMLGLKKKNYKSENPAHKVQAKHGAKKIKSLKHSAAELSKAHKHMRDHMR